MKINKLEIDKTNKKDTKTSKVNNRSLKNLKKEKVQPIY
jgi:hypothetical protein